MKSFVVCDTSGQILRTGRCPEELIEHQAGDNEVAIEAEGDDSNNYVDLINGVLERMPLRPSELHAFNFEIKEWVLPFDALEKAQEAQTLIIKEARDAAEQAGFPYLGKVFDTDAKSVQRMSVAAAAAQVALMNGADYNVTWTCADNSTINMTAKQTAELPLALAAYGDALHQKARVLKAQIANATTLEEVGAVQWT